MKKLEITMKHTEESLTALSHMQYDLFCSQNRTARSVVAAGLFVLGTVNFETWWGLLLIAYGSYLFSSRYAAANRTARQIAQQLKESGSDYPSSRYIFEESCMRIITLPNNSELDPLPYSQVAGLGEDLYNYYIFKSEFGGFMIPKAQIGDENEAEFVKFIEGKTGRLFVSRRSRFVALRQWLRKRNNEPYHL